MKKALQIISFFGFFSVVKNFLARLPAFPTMWISRPNRFFSRFVATLLIVSFIVPPALMPGFLYADEVRDERVTGTDVVPPKSEAPADPDHGEAGNVPPSFEVVPGERENSRTERNEKRNQRAVEAQGSGEGNFVNPLIQISQQKDIKPKTPDVNIANGSLNYSFQFNLPVGRGDVQPELSLVYDSNNVSGDSIVGEGWSFSIPFIQRMSKDGSNSLYTKDIFVSSLSGELVLVGQNIYVPKNENGSFLKYKKGSSGWEVFDKNGVKYSFGSTTQARQDDPSDTSRVFMWMLEEVRDTNNNFASYQYFKDAGQIYPSVISYVGSGTTTGIFKVNFITQSRSNPYTSGKSGFLTTSNYLIQEVRIDINNIWVKKYILSYGNAHNGFGYVLSSITESGRDDVFNTTTLPPTKFSYQSVTNNWTYDSDWNMPIGFFAGEDKGMRMIDKNADGLIDIFCKSAKTNDTCGSSNPALLYTNSGNGWSSGQSGAPVAVVDEQNKDNGVRFFDVNGDGLVDLLHGYNDTKAVYINDGSDWVLDTSWELPIPFISDSKDYGMRMEDINGDNLPDILCHNADPEENELCSLAQPRTYMNTGSGWEPGLGFGMPQNYEAPLLTEVFMDEEDGDYFDSGLRIADVNGDNLADLVRGKGDKKAVYLNVGNTWVYASTSWTLPIPFIDGGGDIGLRFADINGDGLNDLLCHNADPDDNELCSQAQSRIYINTGSGWSLSSSFSFPDKQDATSTTEVFSSYSSGNYYDAGLRLFDVNGDTLPDFVRGKGDQKFTYINNVNKKTNYLTGITYPSKGTTTISYTFSTLIRDGQGNLLNPKTPFPITVVENIEHDSGVDGLIEENYLYASGTYYFASSTDRKFAGFGRVEKTDALGNISKTYFHQGNYTATSTGEYDDHPSKIGKPYLVEQYDNSGNLFARTINTWDRHDTVVASGATSSFVKITQTLEMTYDGDSDHKDKAQTFTYHNTTGNITSKTEYGEVTGATDGTFSDTGTDLFTTSYTYATSTATSSPLFGIATSTLLARELVKNQAGATVSDTKMYYDTQAFGVLTKGNVTKQEMLATSTATTSTYIDIEKTYNSYGLVTQEKDPRDKVTTYTYDTHNLYPATTTNPLGHVTSFVYDYSAGKPTQVTDANGRTFQLMYDGLDRVTQEKQPDPASPSTLVIRRAYVYNDNTFPTNIVQVDELSSTLSVPTYTYLDGLGRPIQERRAAEASNTYSVKDTAYDTRGMKAKESLQYFSTGSARTSALSAGSKLWNHLGYDAIGRIKTISNVVGTTTNTYDDWKLTVTDARGKTKDLTKDARGNLVQVDEKNGTSTYTTTYVWNGLGNLMKITDALGNVRNFAYDNLGRRTFAEDLHAVSDVQFSSSTYSYDAAGNLTSMVDGKGQLVQYAYDELNRVLTEDFAGQSGTEVVYGYDVCANGKGKLCGATTSVAVSAYTYDELGRVASESKRTGAPIYTTSYEYDKQGNQTRVVLPDLSEVKYVYNDAGAVESIQRKDAGGSFVDVVEDIDYSPEGKITLQENANDTETINTYDEDALYRLQNRYTESGLGGISPVLQDISYTYDAVGNITEIDDQSPMNNARTVLYTYDDLSRLASASTTFTGNGDGYKELYTYDAVGNILTKGSANTAYYYQGTTTGSYANPHAVTKMRSTVYVYDNNGNVLSIGGKATSTWDYNNRLTGMSQGATTTSYGYDHSGQRVTYAVNGNTTTYVNKLFNIETVGTTTSTTTHIFLGDDMVATVEKKGTTTNTYYHHTDHLGGSGVTTGLDGTVSEITDYYPFGSIRFSDSSQGFSEQRKFTGHEYDQDTGLNYMGARYYASAIGKFTSIDPVFLSLGTNQKQDAQLLTDPQTLNSYAYARNNPLKYVDQNGEFPVLAALLIYAPAITAFAVANAPQIISYGQSLLGPMGQWALNQGFDDARNGHPVMAMLNIATAGDAAAVQKYEPVFEGLWTVGKTASRAANAIEHATVSGLNKVGHAVEFGLKSTRSYVEETRGFITDAINKGFPTKLEAGKNVDILRVYDKGSNTFSAFEVNKATNGITPRTMMTPKNPSTYFSSQPGKSINISKYFGI